jgi:hypothetical protein
MDATLPDQSKITPVGMIDRTKAVVAIWGVLVPTAAVGAIGVPVKVGLAAKTMLPEPVTF